MTTGFLAAPEVGIPRNAFIRFWILIGVTMRNHLFESRYIVCSAHIQNVTNRNQKPPRFRPSAPFPYGSLLRMCLSAAFVVSSDDSGFFHALTAPPVLPL